MINTPAPASTDVSGKVIASVMQPARPKIGIHRAGRFSAVVRVDAEALAMA
jgi:hypothetical protein